MKILCISDQIDELIYSPSAKERFHDVDLVISAGDLPMEYLGFIASSISVPVLFVFGNHNLKHLDTFKFPHLEPNSMSFVSPPGFIRNSFGATYIDSKIHHTKNLLIAGLGGSFRYNGGKNQFSEWQMWCKILRMIPSLLWNKIRYGRYIDILVTHAPPLGLHDKEDLCHRGFSCFLWFMRTFTPKFLLHGHIHLYDLNKKNRERYQYTDVINIFHRYLLEI